MSSAIYGYDYQFTPIASIGAETTRAGKELLAFAQGEKEWDEVNWWPVFSAFGFAAGLPTGGIKSAAQVVENVVE